MNRRLLISRIVSLMACTALWAAGVTPVKASEEAENGGKIQLAETEGDVEVSNAWGEGIPWVSDAEPGNGDRVTTQEGSCLRLKIGNAGAAKLDAQSNAEFRTLGDKEEILLGSGGLYFDLRGKEINVRTSTAALSIKDACGFLKATDREHTLILLLSGEGRCSVTDPVSGQVKSEALHSGDLAECVVYPENQEGDKCDILLQKGTKEDVDGFVLTELIGDAPLLERIAETSGIDLSDSAQDAGDRLEEEKEPEEETAASLLLEDWKGLNSFSGFYREEGLAEGALPSVWPVDSDLIPAFKEGINPGYAPETAPETGSGADQSGESGAESIPAAPGGSLAPEPVPTAPGGSLTPEPVPTVPGGSLTPEPIPTVPGGSLTPTPAPTAGPEQEQSPAPTQAPEEGPDVSQTEAKTLVIKGIARNNGTIRVKEKGQITLVNAFTNESVGEIHNEGQMTFEKEFSNLEIGRLYNDGTIDLKEALYNESLICNNGEIVGESVINRSISPSGQHQDMDESMVQDKGGIISRGKISDLVQEDGMVYVPGGTIDKYTQSKGWVRLGGEADSDLYIADFEQTGDRAYTTVLGGEIQNFVQSGNGVTYIEGGRISRYEQYGETTLTEGTISQYRQKDGEAYLVNSGSGARVTDGYEMTGGVLIMSGGTLEAGSSDAALTVKLQGRDMSEGAREHVEISGGTLDGTGSGKKAIKLISGDIDISSGYEQTSLDLLYAVKKERQNESYYGPVTIKADEAFDTLDVAGEGAWFVSMGTNQFGSQKAESGTCHGVPPVYVWKKGTDAVYLGCVSDSFESVGERVQGGDTITLRDDISSPNGLNVYGSGSQDAPVILELNGHTVGVDMSFRSDNGDVFWTINGPGTISGEIYNNNYRGTIRIEDSVLNGTLQNVQGTASVVNSELGENGIIWNQDNIEITNSVLNGEIENSMKGVSMTIDNSGLSETSHVLIKNGIDYEGSFHLGTDLKIIGGKYCNKGNTESGASAYSNIILQGRGKLTIGGGAKLTGLEQSQEMRDSLIYMYGEEYGLRSMGADVMIKNAEIDGGQSPAIGGSGNLIVGEGASIHTDGLCALYLTREGGDLVLNSEAEIFNAAAAPVIIVEAITSDPGDDYLKAPFNQPIKAKLWSAEPNGVVLRDGDVDYRVEETGDGYWQLVKVEYDENGNVISAVSEEEALLLEDAELIKPESLTDQENKEPEKVTEPDGMEGPRDPESSDQTEAEGEENPDETKEPSGSENSSEPGNDSGSGNVSEPGNTSGSESASEEGDRSEPEEPSKPEAPSEPEEPLIPSKPMDPEEEEIPDPEGGEEGSV